MDFIKEYMEKGEQIIISSKVDKKTYLKKKLKSQLMIIIMWILMDLLFVYFLTLGDIAQKYWFVAMPIMGFNIIVLLVVFNTTLKDLSVLVNRLYVLTDKAIYFCETGEYKNVVKLAFNEVVRYEKDKEDSSAFYICSKDKFIKVEYLLNQDVWCSYMDKMLNIEQSKNNSTK